MSRTRVAILGGGLSGLVTAWNLTAPEQDEKYDVTIYQLGWRLGGKCATGRNADEHDRIQEHGLHVFMGAYQNAFRMFQELYEFAPDPPFPSWEKAFTPQPDLTLIELIEGKPVPWVIDAPVMPGTPGIDLAPDIWERIAQMLGWIGNRIFDLDPDLPSVSPDKKHWWDPVTRFFRRILGLAQRVVIHAGVWLVKQALELVEELRDVVGREQADHTAVQGVMTSLRSWIAKRYASRLDDDIELRRFFIMADLMLTSVIGGLADGLIFRPEENLERVNRLDYKDWLASHGAAEITVNSAIVRGLYDLIFAYPEGNWQGRGEVEAGTMFVSLMGTATYQGSILWKFNTATGDLIMAPMYEVLKARGVKFEFFHRVDRLVPSTDGKCIARVEMGRQVVPLGGGDYDPLRTLPSGQRVWPDRPLFDRIENGAALEASGADLESRWTDWQDAAPPLVLEAGADYDRLVLAIPPAAHPDICRDLIAQKGIWARMAETIKTTATQSMQTWTTQSVADMGWKTPAMQGGYDISNLDSWSDISEVLPTESWPAGTAVSEQIWCGPLPCPDVLPPASQTNYPVEQQAIVDATAAQFLKEDMPFFFPAAAADGLKPPVLVSQYNRANVDPAERYTLSVRDSTRHRLTAGGSGYDNLALTGDWIQNGQNLGSFEATTISGMLASHAISQWPSDIRGLSEAALAKAMSGALPPAGAFVEMNGEVTFPGPIALDNTRMWAFLLEADIGALTRWCHASFDIPSGGEVRVLPMTGAVMMTVVDIGHGSFTEVPQMGFSKERELTFWIPAVQVEERDGETVATDFAMVLPYLVLDNPVAIASGREIFGYRKQGGRVTVPDDPDSGGKIAVDLFATRTFGPSSEQVYQRLLTLAPTGTTKDFAGGNNYTAAVEAIWDYLKGSAGWQSSLALDFDILSNVIARRVPQLFLKQFRDVEDTRQACYQAVTEVMAEVTRFDALPGLVEYDMVIEALDSSPIASDLGISPRQTVLGVELVFDMAIQPGKVLWQL